jgi:hypothetical protein
MEETKMVDLSGFDHKSLVERAKAIILTPKDEWPKIAAETTSQRDILMSYVIPLAAIGPVASFIGGQLFGHGAFGFSYKPGIAAGLATAVITFALGILGMFVVSLIADALAPKFDGTANKLQAFKLVAYSYTASWLAGIFGLIPSLGFFGLLGLYSFYLLYLGATPLMKVPAEKSVAYTAVTVVCGIIVMAIIGPITAAVTGAIGYGAMSVASSDDYGGKITLPGGGSLETGKMEDLAKQMENAANGKSPPVEATKIQALLPVTIGSYTRTVVETGGLGPVGSEAEATYASGAKEIKLKVTDLAAMGALAGLGAAFGVERTREDANSYERTTTVNGQIQNESWNKVDNRGKFGVVVGNRFMIEAEGKAESIDELKAAVASVDQGNLLSLAS